ncbi:DUF3397 domain-containing protein [Salibacterium salarium]|uniref:DUF3397 domain-containing protein n=1 Tax=Salibacterium salarium TaxID=284579 RepID=UPI00163983CD|nr:DUF3397 domain-containing protein [Salibacterium salarium]
MSQIMVPVLATLFTLPFLAWYIVYIIIVKSTKKKGKAIRMAVDITTVFFIVAVHLLIKEISGQSFLWLIFLIILTTAVLFTIMHYRAREEVEFLRLMKGIWRFTFFLFTAFYILLVCYGWVNYLLSAFIA